MKDQKTYENKHQVWLIRVEMDYRSGKRDLAKLKYSTLEFIIFEKEIL